MFTLQVRGLTEISYSSEYSTWYACNRLKSIHHTGTIWSIRERVPTRLHACVECDMGRRWDRWRRERDGHARCNSIMRVHEDAIVPWGRSWPSSCVRCVTGAFGITGVVRDMGDITRLRKTERERRFGVNFQYLSSFRAARNRKNRSEARAWRRSLRIFRGHGEHGRNFCGAGGERFGRNFG